MHCQDLQDRLPSPMKMDRCPEHPSHRLLEAAGGCECVCVSVCVLGGGGGRGKTGVVMMS